MTATAGKFLAAMLCLLNQAILFSDEVLIVNPDVGDVTNL